MYFKGFRIIPDPFQWIPDPYGGSLCGESPTWGSPYGGPPYGPGPYGPGPTGTRAHGTRARTQAHDVRLLVLFCLKFLKAQKAQNKISSRTALVSRLDLSRRSDSWKNALMTHFCF